MTVKQLLDLLDGINPNYEVNLDIDLTIADSYVTDPVTKSIYLETIKQPSCNQLITPKDPQFSKLLQNYFTE